MTSRSDRQSCLNCDAIVTGQFCSMCGQSIKTHRFDWQHVFTQDFFKKVFYFDKGLFYSLKELFSRPGHSVREYLQGKRVKHLHYFSLLIILVIFFKLTESITTFHYSDLILTDKEEIDFLENALKHHAKIFYISLIPIYALFSFFVFRKAKLNYAEHFVLNAFRSSAILLLNIIFLIIASFIKEHAILYTINQIINVIILMYGVWFYFQLFQPYYSGKISLLVRCMISTLLPLSLLIVSIAFYLNYFRGE